MSSLRFLILTAVLPEARAVARGLELRAKPGMRGCWEGRDVLLVNVGVRAASIVRASEALGDRRPQVIILAGLGGGLDPALAVGDVVISVPSGMNVPAVEGVRLAAVVCSREVIATVADKAALRAQTGAAVVEMEGDAVGRWAAKFGVPVMHVRAVSDSADHALDARFLKFVDAHGRPRVGRAMKFLLSHPGKTAELMRLGQSTKRALHNLVAVMRRLVAADWPRPLSERLGAVEIGN